MSAKHLHEAPPCGPGVHEEVSRRSLTAGRGLPDSPSCHILKAIATSVLRPLRSRAGPSRWQSVTETLSLVHSWGVQDSMGDPGGGAPRQPCQAFPETTRWGNKPSLLKCSPHRATFQRALYGGKTKQIQVSLCSDKSCRWHVPFLERM